MVRFTLLIKYQSKSNFLSKNVNDCSDNKNRSCYCSNIDGVLVDRSLFFCSFRIVSDPNCCLHLVL